MKKFLLKTFLFSLIFMSLVSLFVIRDNPNTIQRNNYLNHFKALNTASPHIILLGDSHAAVLPAAVTNTKTTFNFAFGSDSTYEMYVKALYAINNSKNLHTIVISADHHMFSEYRKSLNNRDYMKHVTNQETFTDLYDEPYPSAFFRFLSRQTLFDKNAYVFVRKRIIRFFKRTVSTENDEVDWIDLPHNKQRDRAKGRARRQLKQKIDFKAVEIYKQIIRLCHKNNIKVIGIKYPLSQFYRDAMQNYDLKPINQIFDSIAFDQYLDYSNLFTEQKYFIDADHLNRDGAEIFLKQLFKDIKK